MSMWQRTVLRILASLIGLALLAPFFIYEFHKSPRQAALINGAVALLVGVYSLVAKDTSWEHIWGYGLRGPYRKASQIFLVLLGVGLIAWAFKL